MTNRLRRSPYIKFLPFLLYYTYYIIRFRYPELFGDEPRYIGFASNLLHGFFSPPAPDINLWNGPGYPIVLMPFVALHLSFLYLPLLNALFYYLSIVFFYKSLNQVVKEFLAMLFAILWAFYHNLYQLLPAIYTEVFTAFLVSALIYSLVLYHARQKTGHLLLSGFLIGFLALTKIIIGYVIVICLILCLVLILFKRYRKYYLKSVYILLLALLTTAPYLLYTYHLTGKAFYWGNSGGMSLYWMSSPYELEYGDWKVTHLSNSIQPMPFKSAEGDSLLRANHQKEMAFILSHKGVEQDNLFKQVAIKQIKASPKKFIRNYFYNLSRLFFDFPYSYTYQITQTISNILIGSMLLWASAICFIVSMINWRRLIYPIKFTMLLFICYILLSGVVSAYSRQLDVMVPLLLFWIAFIFDKFSNFSFKFM